MLPLIFRGMHHLLFKRDIIAIGARRLAALHFQHFHGHVANIAA